MNKYEITFELDFEEDLNYDPDEQHIDINYIDDDELLDTFSTDEKIKEFEKWYNEPEDEEDKIIIEDIDIDSDGEGKYYINVTINKKLNNEKSFAEDIIGYIFDVSNYPRVSYHVTGTTWEDYWDEYRQSPEQRTIKVDYDDSEYVISYTNINISKL